MGQFTLTTKQVCALVSVNRRRMQLLVEGEVLFPVRKGHSAAPGVDNLPDLFSLPQVVAVAYGQAFRDAGAHPSWADAAVAWVGRGRTRAC